MWSNRQLKHVSQVIWKKTSIRNSNVMKRHKPTRDERSWVIGMAEAGFSINDVALHFDIYWITAYRSINRFWQIGFVWDHRDRTKRKKITALEERSFISHQGGRDFFSSKPALLNVYELSLVHDDPSKPPRTVSYARWGWSKFWYFVLFKTFLWQALRSIQIESFNDSWKILYWIRL